MAAKKVKAKKAKDTTKRYVGKPQPINIAVSEIQLGEAGYYVDGEYAKNWVGLFPPGIFDSDAHVQLTLEHFTGGKKPKGEGWHRPIEGCFEAYETLFGYTAEPDSKGTWCDDCNEYHSEDNTPPVPSEGWVRVIVQFVKKPRKSRKGRK